MQVRWPRAHTPTRDEVDRHLRAERFPPAGASRGSSHGKSRGPRGSPAVRLGPWLTHGAGVLLGWLLAS